MGKSRSEIAELYASIGKVITSSVELEDILEGIMKEVKLFFDPENWSLLRFDEATNRLFFMHIEGIDQTYVDEIKLKLGQGIAGYVAKSKKPLLVNDTSSDNHFTDIVDRVTGFKTESVIAVPCIRKKKIYGVIELINQKVKSFSEEDLVILTSIAEFAAIAFENSMLYEQAVNRSATDPLTGLFNHSKLSDLLEESKNQKENQKGRRTGDCVCDLLVVYMDCNNFKCINDTYGHREGDRILKKISTALKRTFRKDDILIRTGGDEFLGIMQIGNENDIQPVKEKIASRLQGLICSSHDMEVSLSYGFAEGRRKNLKKLIHDADVEMYKMKESSKS